MRTAPFVLSLLTACLLAQAPEARADADLTAKVKALVRGTSHDAGAGATTVNVALRNSSKKVVTGPFRMVVQGLGSDAARLEGPDGYTAEGRPYYLFPDLKLRPGRATKARSLVFSTACQAGIAAAFKPLRAATTFAVASGCDAKLTVYATVGRPDPGPNRRPVADAGPDLKARRRQVVLLDGTGSTDRDGDALSYRWSLTRRPRGSRAVLRNARTPLAAFTVDRPGTYVARLVVNDGVTGTSRDLVKVGTARVGPAASAGADQTVGVGSVATLDGSDSTDATGDVVTRVWSIVAAPAGSAAALSDAGALRPTFTADLAGTYVIQLVVSDGGLTSAPDFCVVSTTGTAPAAEPGPDRIVGAGETVTLDGARSTDADGDRLAYAWSLLTRPAGSAAAIAEPAALRTSFVADVAGRYVVQLIASDATGEGRPATASFDAARLPPVADPGPYQKGTVGQVVHLDGSGSAAVGGGAVSHAWWFAALPAGSAAVLAGADTVTPSFTPDVAGAYAVQLRVDDGTRVSAPRTVVVATDGSRPVSDPGADVAADVGDLIPLDGVGSSDADADPLAFTWSLLYAPPGSGAFLSTPLEQVATFQPDLPGVYVAQLAVEDGTFRGFPATVAVDAAVRMITVPDVVGQAQSDAEAALGAASLAVGTVTTEHSATVPSGHVISQNPPPGSSAPKWSAVSLAVSLGPQLVPVPDLLGMTQAAADTTLVAVGLRSGTVDTAYHDTAPAGTVFSQIPAAGTVRPESSRVYYTLSLGAAVPPPDPGGDAPPVDQSITTDVDKATDFLHAGPDPVQKDVPPGTIDPERAAVIRGKVLDRAGSPLPGVRVAVHRHPEFGHTLSRADGMFDLVVNGGGYLTLRYDKGGFLTVQRQISVGWQVWAWAPDVALIPVDTNATVVDFSAPVQTARGSVVTDARGTRQSTVLFREGTAAAAVLPDGSSVPLPSITVRSTEYTVGDTGPEAMPAELPPGVAYTWAAELGVDEAAGATSVTFDRPVAHYVENFLGFPVGDPVPAYYYDRERAVWVPVRDGRVIEVLGETVGLADVDADGDGLADDAAALAALGMDDAERVELAALYAAGTELWRVALSHFTPLDYNWPLVLPPTATPPTPPTPPTVRGRGVNCARTARGSILECENQVLGEEVAVTGTPYTLNYRSSRVPGFAAGYTLEIPLTGAAPPLSLVDVRVVVDVAGQHSVQTLPAGPDLAATYAWDGTDAFGRPLQGLQPVRVRIGYTYLATYRCSGGGGGGECPPAELQTLWSEWNGSLGPWDFRGAGLGGWSLDVHHVYEPMGRELLLGTGGRRSAAGTAPVITEHLDISGAVSSWARYTASLAVGRDGSIYVAPAERWFGVLVARPGQPLVPFAGTGVRGFSGDGGPATQAQLDVVGGIAVAPDGTVYLATGMTHRVRKIAPDGIITTVAGTGVAGFSGDGGPATAARLNNPINLAVGPDGGLFIADVNNHRVRRVGTDGIIETVLMPPGYQSWYEYYYATPRGLAVDGEGNLFVGFDCWGTNMPLPWRNTVVRKRPDGPVEIVAGSESQCYPAAYGGDGGPATAAVLTMPDSLALGSDGSLYIAEDMNYVIRRVSPDGVISTVAGLGPNSPGCDYNYGGPAAAACVPYPQNIAIGPGGDLFIENGQRVIRRVAPAFPGMSVGEIPIAAADGRELFVFDLDGRHLRTHDARTGATLLSFRYVSGRLSEVEDVAGNVTTIQRDGAGNPLAILAPGGQRTALALDPEGFLAGIDDPSGEGWSFTYTAGGLMTGAADPNGAAWVFAYDADGLLERDDHPAGGFQSLAQALLPGGFTVTRGTALGRTTTYSVEAVATGGERGTVVSDAAGVTETLRGSDGVVAVTRPDGTVATLRQGPDPRFGMLAPIVESAAVALPSALTRSTTLARSVTLSNPNDLLSLETMSETFRVSGRTFTRTYDAATRESLLVTPEGRQAAWGFDAQGRVVERRVGTLSPVSIAYDTAGRPSTVTAGVGPDSRTAGFSYDTAGRLSVLTDPLGRSLTFGYDLADRVSSVELPGGRTVAYGFDAAGNLTSLAPPGRPAHGMAYLPGGLPLSYTPPDVGGGTGPTGYTHNLDGQLTGVALPGGVNVGVRYEPSGLPEAVELPAGDLAFTWDGTTRQLATATTPQGQVLAFDWDGFLPAGETWSGPVSGSVAWTRDASFRVVGESVNGEPDVVLAFDGDDLLLAAGDAVLSRDAATGLLSGVTVGGVFESLARNGFGEVTGRQVTHDAATLFEVSLTRDKLGRIIGKTETVGGATETYGYSYDAAGRLEEVTRGGAAWYSYAYDANGNRTSATGPGGTVAATHDGQDRLLTQGALAFTYTPAGFLATRADTGASEVTSYTYDPLGNLERVVLPGGTTVEYTVDAFGRRVGKSVDGTPVQGFLYRNRLQPLAELDGAGAVVSRFVYGSRANVPDYLVRGGVAYRIVADHLGSPRLVVNVADGTVAQRMDYDPSGRVVLDTAPGFQPFGFAGGLYDPATGLVRFGARDYDAETGRWTAKDPIGFRGGDANLYAYVGNDPVNSRDATGLATNAPHPGIPFDPSPGAAAAVELVDLGTHIVGMDVPTMGSGIGAGLGDQIHDQIVNGFDYDAYLDDGPSFSERARDFNNDYEAQIIELRRLLGCR